MGLLARYNYSNLETVQSKKMFLTDNDDRISVLEENDLLVMEMAKEKEFIKEFVRASNYNSRHINCVKIRKLCK